MVAQMTGLFGEDKIQHDTTFHRLGKEVFGVFLERKSSTPPLYLTVHGTYEEPLVLLPRWIILYRFRGNLHSTLCESL